MIDRVKEHHKLRFAANVRKMRNGCWEWAAYRDKDGYGVIRIGKSKERAHRVSYVLASKNDIPPGLFVCHKCDYPPCVRPEHLFVGTPKDNTQDMQKKGRRGLLRHSKATRRKFSEIAMSRKRNKDGTWIESSRRDA